MLSRGGSSLIETLKDIQRIAFRGDGKQHSAVRQQQQNGRKKESFQGMPGRGVGRKAIHPRIFAGSHSIGVSTDLLLGRREKLVEKAQCVQNRHTKRL